MAHPQQFLKEEFIVTSADVDVNHRASCSAIIKMFIQIAWHHAQALGFGPETLHKNQLVWIFNGFKMQIFDFPRWNQNLRVITWPTGFNRLFYLRDMEMHNKEGNRLVALTSNWLLIDMQSRRPKQFDIENPVLYASRDKRAIDELVPSLKFNIEEPEFKEERFIRYSDLDFNKHLTTTRYIDFIFDSYSPGFLQEHPVKSLAVNFIKEVPFNTRLEIMRKQADHKHHITLLFPDNCKAACRAELEFG